MFHCTVIRVFWKIVSNLIFFLFDIEIDIGMKTLLVGYEIKNKKYRLLNFMINYAQLVLYKDYVQRNFGEVQVNPKRLLNKLILSMKSYLNYKSVKKHFDQKDIEKIMDML